MRRIVLPVALGLLGLGLILLVFNHDRGETLGLANDDFASLVYLTALASVIGTFVVSSRHGLGTMLRQALIWLIIMLVLATGYLYRGEIQDVGARLAAGLIPGRPISRSGGDGSAEVIIHRGAAGHFTTTARINGQPIPVLVDTGASLVALTFDDARAVGLDPGGLSFSQRIATANGVARAANVRLDELAIGDIRRQDVRATVSEPGALGFSLLGMNFLDTLQSFEMTREALTLRE